MAAWILDPSAWGTYMQSELSVGAMNPHFQNVKREEGHPARSSTGTCQLFLRSRPKLRFPPSHANFCIIPSIGHWLRHSLMYTAPACEPVNGLQMPQLFGLTRDEAIATKISSFWVAGSRPCDFARPVCLSTLRQAVACTGAARTGTQGSGGRRLQNLTGPCTSCHMK